MGLAGHVAGDGPQEVRQFTGHPRWLPGNGPCRRSRAVDSGRKVVSVLPRPAPEPTPEGEHEEIGEKVVCRVAQEIGSYRVLRYVMKTYVAPG